MLLAAAIERLYDLNVGTTPVQEGAPHEKPHKPLLLLAAFDLIDEGLITPDTKAFHPYAAGLKWRCEKLIA